MTLLSIESDEISMSTSGTESIRDIYILTSRHTVFVAELIKHCLNKRGINSRILTRRPIRYRRALYIVICPQVFKILPEHYIAFQMEQTISDRWMTEDYLNTLNSAECILDYSTINVDYLRNSGYIHKPIYYIPIDVLPVSLANNSFESESYKHDVLFYGDINSSRRREFIERLSSIYSVKVLTNSFGNRLYNSLDKSKVVINIHYYEDALLETVRLYEVLSRGRSIIVSESSRDRIEDRRISGFIDLFDAGNVDQCIERVGFWLTNDNARVTKLEQSVNMNRHRVNEFSRKLLELLDNVILQLAECID